MANSILDITEILNDYSIDIQDGITQASIDIAKKGVAELKNTKSTYKVKTGKYNRGWRVKTEKGNGYVRSTIHNATNWQLTHLLENGHDFVDRYGHRKKNTSRPFKHIAPVEDKCIKEYKKTVETIIKNGG